MNGSFLSDLGLPSCGNITRDHNRNFVAAWSLNLEHCTIIVVELWAIFWGLFINHSLGFNNIILEPDSNATRMLIEQESAASHAHTAIINSIRNLLVDEWIVEISRVYREANNCANKLAKLDHRYLIGLSFFY